MVKFHFQGNQRRGLTAKCRRVDGCEYEVTASEVALPANTPGSHHLAAYPKWMGVLTLSTRGSHQNAPRATCCRPRSTARSRRVGRAVGKAEGRSLPVAG